MDAVRICLGRSGEGNGFGRERELYLEHVEMLMVQPNEA